jgi:deoxyribonuclease-4
MSIAGGLHLALERGAALGCFAVQIFVKNQRQWAARPLGDDEARAFRAARRSTGVRAVFAHASYLINLASPDPIAWERAVSFFTDELERAEALGLACVAIHPGSHLGTGIETGLDRVATAVREVLRRTRGYRVRVALENTAGGGGSVGRTFGELGALLRRLQGGRRVGVCLDTCHLFAAGYDIRSPAGYHAAMD